MEKLASVLLENLNRWGVKHLFGIPGKPIVPLILAAKDKGIEFILSRHEGGAGYEAAGYAIKKGLGVAVGTSGPGGTNLITAAAQAKAYHVPVLFLTGQPPITYLGAAQGQDSTYFGTDLVHMFNPVTKFSARVDRADLLKPLLTHALEKAFNGVKGPVHLSIPMDILLEEIEPFTLPLPNVFDMIAPNLDEVVNKLNNAQNPIMMLGKGIHSAKAYDEVLKVAEFWDIPVITTPGGKGTFPTNHPLSIGPFGLGGYEEVNEHLKSTEIDLMLVIGSKLTDMSLAGFTKEMYPKNLIHFDYDLTFINKTLPVPTIAVPGDAKVNLRHVLASPAKIKKNNGRVFEFIKNSRNETSNLVESFNDSNRISAAETMKVLREVLPNNALIFGDDGSHTFYAIKYFDIFEPGTFRFDDVFGAMGHAIGYAVGAKIATPEEYIICLTGDGSLFMHGSEISTAVNNNANLIFVVLNNGRLDMVDKGMKNMVGYSVGVLYNQELNVSEYAKSMGAEGFRCYTPEDIRRAIKFGLNSSKVTVVEIMVDPEEVPPTLKRA